MGTIDAIDRHHYIWMYLYHARHLCLVLYICLYLPINTFLFVLIHVGNKVHYNIHLWYLYDLRMHVSI